MQAIEREREVNGRRLDAYKDCLVLNFFCLVAVVLSDVNDINSQLNTVIYTVMIELLTWCQMVGVFCQGYNYLV